MKFSQLSVKFVEYHQFAFNNGKTLKDFTKFCQTDYKISVNIH
jgi:hypothetical protein